MPNTREKLIELLCNTPAPEVVVFGQRCGKALVTAEFIADHLIANGVTFAEGNNVFNKWIPVTERLPTHREWVLVWHTGYKTPKKAFYKDDLAPYLPIFRLDGDNGIHGEVTHWQPLPEPPNT